MTGVGDRAKGRMSAERAIQVLLWVYPRDFRRHHGPGLSQTIRDDARRARTRQRVGGTVVFWIGSAADVVANGVCMRLWRPGAPAGTVFVRWAGTAATLGGTAFMISMLTPLRGPLRAAVPASVALMAVGAAGLYVAIHGRNPRLERLGMALAGTGLALGFIGMAGSATGVVDPNPWAPVINTGEHLGLPLIGAGMIIWGVLAVQTRALGHWSYAPIPIGALGLLGLAAASKPAFRAIEASTVPILFAASWIVLGIGLWTTGLREQAQTAR